jgi:2-polyprenyl-3-methyl-5-hydroxy-6-metoxy-1,4-benzoquinol methylase
MDHRKHFYERYTQAQSRFGSKAEALQRVSAEQSMLREFVSSFLPASKQARVVDLGCGYGAFLMMLRDSGYTNLRGIDISPEQVALAHDLGASMVEQGTLETAIAQERNVALVTMFDVIEHLTRAEAISVLQGIHGMLDDGGVLLLRTPNVDAALGTVLSFGDLTHEMHLNKYSALELFASLDYRQVDILPVKPVGGSLAARLIRGIIGPITSLGSHLAHITQGISRSATISTPNMLIVARR